MLNLEFLVSLLPQRSPLHSSNKQTDFIIPLWWNSDVSRHTQNLEWYKEAFTLIENFNKAVTFSFTLFCLQQSINYSWKNILLAARRVKRRKDSWRVGRLVSCFLNRWVTTAQRPPRRSRSAIYSVVMCRISNIGVCAFLQPLHTKFAKFSPTVWGCKTSPSFVI